MKLSDIVAIRREQAAIVLEDGLKNKELASSYIPTQASIDILKKVLRAIAPDAKANERAFNWFGTYGAGKSRLGVLVGQALGDGVAGPEFKTLLKRLTDINENALANSLKSHLLAPDDEDARPYFIVPLYSIRAGSIQAALLEALYESLVSAGFDPAELMPKTAFDVAVERIAEMREGAPYLNEEYLPKRNIGDQYLSLGDLEAALKNRENAALDFFSRWHKLVTYGVEFAPENFGAKSFDAIYIAASTALKQRKYRGIAVIWDEFGYMVDDMLTSKTRNAQAEIRDLQRFVEYACAPAQGHTLFIGLTHVSLGEYGPRQNVAEGIQEGLTKIEGRFTILKVEMKAAESEGYHLLAAQVEKTDNGRTVLAANNARAQKVIDACQRLDLFSHLGSEMEFVTKQCYPMHPVTTAALLALSNNYAAATRTAFHFLPELESRGRLDFELPTEELYRGELVRAPELIEYYGERFRQSGLEDQLDAHFKNVSQLGADGAERRDIDERRDVLAMVFLASVLGAGFQASDAFLAVALRDGGFDSPECAGLRNALTWLSNAGLLWKNPTTHLWKAGGDGSIDVEKMIDENTNKVPKLSLAQYLSKYSELADDLLPMLGVHNLDPSANGIVRRYRIEALSATDAGNMKLDDFAAKVIIVVTSGLDEAQQFEHSLLGKGQNNVFYWISQAEPQDIDQLVRRYLGITMLLTQSHNDATKTRLTAKFEAVRNSLKASFGRLYGREGLREKSTRVIHEGVASPVEVSSWHAFGARLKQIVDATYSGEIAVRAPQDGRNILGEHGGADSKATYDIVDAILKFQGKSADDLLGFSETSPQASIIDGVLGANAMFIKRAGGWDLKAIDELDGNIKTVVEEIRSLLFKRRERAYPVYDLRRHLESARFGIPAGAIPLLVAYAVRNELGRLTWNTNASAAKNICEGVISSKIGVRFSDFSGHQLNVLEVVRHVLDRISETKFSWASGKQESARQAVGHLHELIKLVPEPVFKSNKLDQRFRHIADAFKGVAISTHAIVDRLASIIDPDRALTGSEPPYDTKKKASDEFEKILVSYHQIEDERRFEFAERVRAAVADVEDDSQRDSIIAEISVAAGVGETIAKLLAKFPWSDRTCLALIEGFSGRRFDDITDASAGEATGMLKVTVSNARRMGDMAAASLFPALPTALDNQGTLQATPGTTVTNGAANTRPFWPGASPTVPTAPVPSPTRPFGWPGAVEDSLGVDPEDDEDAAATPDGTVVAFVAPGWLTVPYNPAPTASPTQVIEPDWQASLRQALDHWSSQVEVDKTEMVALLQSFIVELEAKA
jgi:hypothetical protein